MRAGPFIALTLLVAGTPPDLPRRIWSGPGVDLSGGPSPDGRLLAYTDPHTGGLAVRELATGASRVLTDSLPWAHDGYALSAVFSPDSRSIAFTWYQQTANLVELRVMPLDSAASAPLYVDREGTMPLLVDDWMPDGSAVLARTTEDSTHRGVIVRVPVRGGRPVTVRQFDGWRPPYEVRVSPDGRYLAYEMSFEQDDGSRSIRILSLADGRETIAVSDEPGIHLIGWTNSGRRIVYSDDQNGSPSVWTRAVRNGAVTGEPTLVLRDLWRSFGLRVANHGTLFYAVSSGDKDLFMAAWDPATGALRSPPVSATKRPGEAYYVPAWSPDGRYISYITLGGGNGSLTGPASITIRSADGALVRVLQPDLPGLDGSVWSPDGASLILRTSRQERGSSLFRMDLRSGALTPLARGTHQIPAFSRDGREMYFVPDAETDPPPPGWIWHVVAHNLATGAERTLYSAPANWRIPGDKRLVTSPDGTRLLIIAGPCCPGWFEPQVVDLRTGTSHGVLAQPAESLPIPLRSNANVVGFTPDERDVLFIAFRRGNEAGVPEIWQVPVEGGIPKLVMPGVHGVVRLSPDGRRVLYVTGRISLELWRVEDEGLM